MDYTDQWCGKHRKSEQNKTISICLVDKNIHITVCKKGIIEYQTDKINITFD